MKKQVIIGIIFIVSISFFFFWKQDFQMVDVPVRELENEMAPLVSAPESLQEDAPSLGIEKQEAIRTDSVLQDVPFTSQAPTGNWKDPIFQNACEEAALLMADKWVSGKKFGTPKETEVEIRKITKEEELYFPKDSYDLSVQDILILAQKYFPGMRISLMENVTKDDMRNALFEGKVIIIPANGQKLHNPNFTAPGPRYHTLLIRGYDPAIDEFIVNDPGTQRGNAYRYASDILYNAMQNYATGHHGKTFPDEKVMLIIQKPSLGSPTSK